MKNLLLASTALIGFAGVAAAEVVIEGSAEMGVTGGDLKETQFHNSYNINFKMSGETDTGLSFGATYRLDADGSSEENQNPAGDNGTVFISGAFGKLTLGDTDGALDWAMTETAMGTAITDEGTTHVGYNGNGDGFYDDQVLRYEYAFGDFGVALSVEQNDENVYTESDPVIAIGGKYKTEFSGIGLAFGLGYQGGEGIISSSFDTDAVGVVDAAAFGEFDKFGVSAAATMDNGFSLILNYSKLEMDASSALIEFGTTSFATAINEDISVEHYGIGLGYEMGALLLHANYGKYEWDLPSVPGVDVEEDYDSFGLIANYDLGGGAILAAGYASDVSAEDGDQDQFSLGLSLSF